MEYTIRDMIQRHGRSLEETDYAGSRDEMLDFRLISGEFYEWEGRKLRFKDCVTVMDYNHLVNAFPPFSNIQYKRRDLFPYFAGDIQMLADAWKSGKQVAVEGGPCLFGQYEVSVIVYLKDGRTELFDYANGKAYLNEAEKNQESSESGDGFSEEESLAGYLQEYGMQVERIAFRHEKPGLTSQEYLNLRYPFETAAALGGPLVIPIPDMSYRKYLLAVLEYIPEEIRQQTLADFDAIVARIIGYYLETIEKLQAQFQIKQFKCVYGESLAELEAWYSARAAYVERGKILHGLTRLPEKIEAIKDYISMPGLPFYLFGSDLILQMDSVDETDSYRKCKKAHRKAFQMGCIMMPELLSDDGVHTVYNAPTEWKKYGNYELLTNDYLGRVQTNEGGK